MLEVLNLNYKSENYQRILHLVKSILPINANLSISGMQGVGKSIWSLAILESSVGVGAFKRIDIKEIDEDRFKLEIESAKTKYLLLENIEYLHKENQNILYSYIQNKLLSERPVIISTSRRSLAELNKEGLIRPDLYYKLSVFTIQLPELKATKEDICTFAKYFLNQFSFLYKKSDMKFSDDAIQKLESFFWPGNILELENVIERAILMCDSSVVTEKQIRFDEFQRFNPLDLSLGMSLSEVERRLILQTLEHTQNNRTKAAHILGISIRTLRNKINEYKEAGLI